MRNFLKDTWPYILFPFLLLGALIAVFLFVFDDSPAPFIYNVY